MKHDQSELSNYQSLLCGAASGGIAKTVVAPLDRAKIIVITNQLGISSKSMMAVMKKIIQEGGVSGLWRGNMATVARIAPWSAGRFFIYENAKNIYNHDSTHSIFYLAAGIIFGIVSLLISYPISTVRSRLAVTDKKRYSNSRDTVRTIYIEEGISAFYRGFVPCFASILPYAGISFFTFEALKACYVIVNPSHASPGVTFRMFAGGVGGFLATLIIYPLDVVKHAMQNDGANSRNYKYRGMWHCAKSIYDTSGFKNGIYAGISINLVKTVIANSVGFTTFDLISNHIKNSKLE